MKSSYNFFAVRSLLVAFCCCAASGNAQTITPIDVVGRLPLTEYNTYIKRSFFGNEPFVAVDPLNFKQVVVSSFTGFNTPRASLWYSTNAGANWGIRFPINSNPAPGFTAPGDQNYAYDNRGLCRESFWRANLSLPLPLTVRKLQFLMSITDRLLIRAKTA